MATDKGQLENIRHQAERVVRAYKSLREAPKNSDFKSDDFPVGLFAELVGEIKRLDGWLEPEVATDCEYIENELGNLREIIDGVEHLATDGEASNDPAATMAVIKRLARDAHGAIHGKLWDQLTDMLGQQPYRPLYGELWTVIEDFSADELASLRSYAAAIRTRRS